MTPHIADRGSQGASSRLIVALDVDDPARAHALVDALGTRVGTYKIGLEFVFSGGLSFIEAVRARGADVFLDVKLLDIGNTVERAVAQIAQLDVQMLTVHGHDTKTLEAAVAGRGQAAMALLSVTVMTHLSQADLAEQGIGMPVDKLVSARAAMAVRHGFDGVVASAREANALRAALGEAPLIVTPGIRPTGAASGDQTRVSTPGDALRAGASHLVIGRPITAAADPAAAADEILLEMEAALAA